MGGSGALSCHEAPKLVINLAVLLRFGRQLIQPAVLSTSPLSERFLPVSSRFVARWTCEAHATPGTVRSDAPPDQVRGKRSVKAF